MPGLHEGHHPQGLVVEHLVGSLYHSHVLGGAVGVNYEGYGHGTLHPLPYGCRRIDHGGVHPFHEGADAARIAGDGVNDYSIGALLVEGKFQLGLFQQHIERILAQVFNLVGLHGLLLFHRQHVGHWVHILNLGLGFLAHLRLALLLGAALGACLLDAHAFKAGYLVGYVVGLRRCGEDNHYQHDRTHEHQQHAAQASHGLGIAAACLLPEAVGAILLVAVLKEHLAPFLA